MTTTLISAVIPCFNTRGCVVRSVASALAQENAAVEVVLVDDGSTDGTPEEVERAFAGDPRVRIIRQPRNLGPSATRNVGFAAAHGEWIALLDSDDAWHPARLRLLLDHVGKADFIADNLMGFDAVAGRETGPVYAGLSDRFLSLRDFLMPAAADRHDFGYLQPVVRTAFLRRHRIAYREDVRAGEDLLFNLAVLMAGGRAFYVDRPLYIYATPVGALSRSASPHSRSTADMRPLIAALEELRRELAGRLAEDEADAFDRRLATLRAEVPIGRFHRARAQGDYLGMARLALAEPAVRRKILARLLGAKPIAQEGR